MSKKLDTAKALALIVSLLSASLLHSREPEKAAASEFDIFEKSSDKDDSEKKEPLGLQMDLIVQKQFARDSLFFPDQEFASLDPWIFTQFLRYSKNPKAGDFFSVKIDMGLRSTTDTKKSALKTISAMSPDTNVMNMVHPMFDQELSFLHFYAYELSFNFTISPTTADSFFLTGGILPVKFGNSFYKNPVSFFERYLPPRDFIQEYNPLSLPGIKLGYVHGIYNIDILFVPEIPYSEIGKNGDGVKFSEYLYFLNSANVLTVKNSFDFSTVQMSLFFFWENQSKTENYFGFGSELSWRMTDSLSLNFQLMVSNGKPSFEISEQNFNNSIYYSFEAPESSYKKYQAQSLVSFNFSGVKDYDMAVGYYYNGFGFSNKLYNELTDTLEIAKQGYASADPVLKGFHLLYFSSVLAQYDLFALSQHYLFLNIAALHNMEIVTWGLSAFFTLERFSVMPVLFVNLNINSQMKIYLQAAGSLGKAKSVFQESPLAASVNGGVQWSF